VASRAAAKAAWVSILTQREHWVRQARPCGHHQRQFVSILTQREHWVRLDSLNKTDARIRVSILTQREHWVRQRWVLS